jgi:HK97 family phage major capsid protein
MEIAEAVADLKSHFQTNYAEIKSLVEKQDAEIRKNGETTAETAKALAEATKRHDEIAEELKSVQTRIDEAEVRMKRSSGMAPERKSPGMKFVESDAYKAYAGNEFNGKSAAVEFTKSEIEPIDGGSLGDTPGYFYAPSRVPGIINQPDRPERVRSLLPTVRTSVGAIEYVRETGFTNNAGPQIEGEPKAESTIEFEIVQDTVKTLAHYIKATRQIIADQSTLLDYINSRLLTGIDLEEDNQLLYGDGLAGSMLGIMETIGVQEYSWSDGPVGDTKIDAVRRAMLKARVAEYPISGVVLHPDDWADIELTKGGDGHYIWVSVPQGGEMRLWRAPVVETTAIESGEFLTGAFGLGAAVWDRENATIRIADQHDSDFVKNLWTILAEKRLALTVYRPEAFVKGEFDEAPAS